MGGVLSNSAATDLTDGDVVGLVELRLRGGAALQCQVPRHTSIAAQRATVNQFLGETAHPGSPCRVHHVDGAQLAPPVAVVRVVQHYGWRLFVASALLMMLLAMIATVVLLVRGPKVDGPHKGAVAALRHLFP